MLKNLYFKCKFSPISQFVILQFWGPWKIIFECLDMKNWCTIIYYIRTKNNPSFSEFVFSYVSTPKWCLKIQLNIKCFQAYYEKWKESWMTRMGDAKNSESVKHHTSILFSKEALQWQVIRILIQKNVPMYFSFSYIYTVRHYIPYSLSIFRSLCSFIPFLR